MVDVAQLLKTVVMAYLASWNFQNQSPLNIPSRCLTHVNYAFAKPSNGVIAYGDPATDVDLLIKNTKWSPGQPRYFQGMIDALTNPRGPISRCNPNLKKLIAIGGWTDSGEFSTVASSAKARRRFARSVIRYIHKHKFDGVDIDWEYPVGGGLETNAVSPDDKQNFVLLLQELRRQLDRYQKLYKRKSPLLLTAATAISQSLTANLDLPAMARTLDWFNLMIYDFAGPWMDVTAHNAPFKPGFVDAVQLYLDGGVDPSKLVTGVPLYAKEFLGAKSKLIGSGYNSSPEATPSFDDIQENFTKANGFERIWDPTADAGYLYNEETNEFVTYEAPNSSFIKAQYALQKKLRGMFMWELSYDSKAVILQKLLQGLGLAKKSYRQSCFC